MLFLVAVVERPTQTEQGKGKTEKVVVQPKVMVAASQALATRAMLMSGDIPKDTDPARTAVEVIPFVHSPGE